MRVIAGQAGGITLKSINTKKVRPTLDRVKEALFSIILPYFPKTNGLDLYAGFGNLGLEAVSRGVEKLTFVEKSPKFASIIKENIDKCGFTYQCQIVVNDVLKYLRTVDQRFDIVFLDPPYNRDLVNKTIKSLVNNKLLINDALIIVEHHEEEKIEKFNSLIKIKDRNYNKTAIKVYLKRSDTL
ncbi:MAG: 16S rRNA (guanine(966)-N(2))-methyltransferase RsmD [Halanaerobiales bacterium]|nr:16S rRNA (guanine(966)-N(2))-methyltransferase RsmD [Halanaerobiales bacterium]